MANSKKLENKLPAHDKNLEEAILGAILLEKNAYETAVEYLTEESFYIPLHQTVFRAITELNRKNQAIDIFTVGSQIVQAGEAGPTTLYEVTKLTNSVVSSAHIETHCRKVKLLALKRKLYTITNRAAIDAISDEVGPYEIIENIEHAITDIHNADNVKNFLKLDEEIARRITRVQELKNRGEEITGVPSGFKLLDKNTKGWQETDLIILAARPSVGKTAFAINIARNAAMSAKKTATAFFSLEMSAGQIVDRLLAAETNIPAEFIKNGQCTDVQMEKLFSEAVIKLSQAPIFIDDTAALNFYELRAKCRRMKRKNDLGLIIIDYLQLMSGEHNKGNREQEISQISRNLKGLAKELKVPVIALSQLSRAVESRSNEKKIPQLSDLRESGAIEQDADMVMFLYRPEYYDITANESGESTKGETHVRIAKHRNGSLDTVILNADLNIQKFSDSTQPHVVPIQQVQGWRPVQEED